jgi:hypothetical protein
MTTADVYGLVVFLVCVFGVFGLLLLTAEIGHTQRNNRRKP